LQVIGRRGADLDVLAAAAAFERARPWDHIYEIPANRSLTG
jgi:amidase/aspartyl-tRNA(Asn)/glutamyl-tRNA(Gln) amidotransferase subunit A